MPILGSRDVVPSLPKVSRGRKGVGWLLIKECVDQIDKGFILNEMNGKLASFIFQGIFICVFVQEGV